MKYSVYFNRAADSCTFYPAHENDKQDGSRDGNPYFCEVQNLTEAIDLRNEILEDE